MKKARGYIALMSALLMAIILTSLVLVSSMRVFLARSDERYAEYRMQSELLARSCAFVALHAFMENNAFTANHSVVSVSPDQTCTIDSVSKNTNRVIVVTHASNHDALVVLRTVAAIPSGNAPLSILSQQEETSIPP